MMKDTKTEKNKLRRYLDDMYIREEASQLLESMRDADHKDILDELSAEVWEESVSQQPVTDLEREKYKKGCKLSHTCRSGSRSGIHPQSFRSSPLLC